MTFDYVPIVVSAADDGEPLLLFRPELDVTIHGPGGVTTVRALVDTGADYTVFPLEVAALTGIDTSPAVGPPIQSFGGLEVDVRYADVHLQLDFPEMNVNWIARTFFSADPSGDDTVVVGHVGFLEFFRATFRGDLNSLEIEANEFLPRID